MTPCSRGQSTLLPGVEGSPRIWAAGRLDLTVEARVLKPEYAGLFTDEERRIARRRLDEYQRST